ncbi:MAG: hypothetical protein D6805_10370 [Planctomycetota bacterium]|nr:MAG: hypothetical protein D6805_10370 [Planctomycetota bacterium]
MLNPKSFWRIFLALAVFVSLLSSCTGVSYEPKKKKEAKREKDRGVVKVRPLSKLKQELSPKSPKDAVTGFFQAIKKGDFVRAYAYAYSKEPLTRTKFLTKYRKPDNPLHTLLTQPLAVRVEKESSNGEVQCKITLPDLFEFNRQVVELQRRWDEALAKEKQQKKKRKVRRRYRRRKKQKKIPPKKPLNDQTLTEQVVRKFSKPDPNDPKKFIYTGPTKQVTFTAYTVKEKNFWWLDITKTWRSLKLAYNKP